MDILDLFTEQVIPEPNTGCWLCFTSNNQRGYGRIRIGRRLVTAHRLSYELSVGPIPEGMDLDHLCRQPCCVNPDHLEPVTPFENGRRAGIAKEKDRNFHCRRGHKRTEKNTKIRANGKKVCEICLQASREKYLQKVRGQ